MHHQQDLIEHLRTQLRKPLPGSTAHYKMAGRKLTHPLSVPLTKRDSAVLCLLFHRREEWWIILIRRIMNQSVHSGQISFPGGKWEDGDEQLSYTALRETQEEIGLAPNKVELLGALTPLYIPVSNYLVHPYIGVTAEPSDYEVNDEEVASIIEAPLAHILDEGRKAFKKISVTSLAGALLNVPIYQLDNEDFIWGATAMILSELECIIQQQ